MAKLAVMVILVFLFSPICTLSHHQKYLLLGTNSIFNVLVKLGNSIWGQLVATTPRVSRTHQPAL